MKIRLLVFSVFATVLLADNKLTAQPCTPNTLNTTTGFSPNPPAPVMQGISYDQVLQLYVPLNISTYTIDSIQFTSISGFPLGIYYAINPASGTIYGGGNGCIAVVGITSDTIGNYPLTCTGTAYIAGLGNFPLSTVETIDPTAFNATVQVVSGAVPGVYLDSNQTICMNSTLIMNPHVVGGTAPYSYYWLSNGNQLSCNTCSNPTVTVTQTSTYILAVTDVNNLVFMDTVTYIVNGNTSALQLAFTNTGLSCTSAVDTTTVTVSNGTGPYRVEWGNNSTLWGQASPASYNYLTSG